MFGTTKNNLDNILVNTFTNKKVFKNAFHTLMNALKENKESREFFTLYSQVENKNFTDKDSAETYLNEVVKTLKEKRNHLKVTPINTTINRFEKYIGESTNEIYSNLDLLIFNKNVNKLEEVVSTKQKLLNHLTKPLPVTLKESRVPNSLLINIGAKRFNEKFNSLSSGDKEKFKELYSKDAKELKEEFQTTKEQLTTKINNLINSSNDKDLVSKLEKTNKKINEDCFSKKGLLKIKNLNKTLV
jgi:hypothetical protein